MRAWVSFLGSLEKKLGKEAVKKWVRPLKIEHYDARNIYFKPIDPFQFKWIEEHLFPHAETDLFNSNNHPIQLHFNAPPPKKKKTEPTQPSLTFDTADPTCTEERTLFLTQNALIQKLLPEITSPPFNPIYLYGTGKTHHLMLFAQKFKEQKKLAPYIRAETFMQHFIDALRQGDLIPFREAYRTLDALIFDDIHLLARKSATQEEFFHTFNTLHSQNIPIIIAGNRPPQELEEIESRLTSRFEWGLTIKLHPFAKEDLKKLIQIKAKTYALKLSPDITQFLLETFPNTPAPLTQAMHLLALRSTHTPNLNDVKILLHELIEENKKKALTPEEILLFVSREFGIPKHDILGLSRRRECSLPRQLSMWLIRSLLHLPLQEIGSFFNRDHSTVITSLRAIQKEVDLPKSDLGRLATSLTTRITES